MNIPKDDIWRPTYEEMLDLQETYGNDMNIARIVGRSSCVVGKRRRKHGIPALENARVEGLRKLASIRKKFLPTRQATEDEITALMRGRRYDD